MVFIFCVAVAVIVVTVVLAPIVMDEGVPSRLAEPEDAVGEHKERIRAALTDLQFDYECGKLDEQDYRILRDSYLRQATRSPHGMEPSAPLEGNGPTPGENERDPYCESCRIALPETARYCHQCGLELPA